MKKQLSPMMLELVAERFRVLSEPIRLQLVNLLRDGELSVSELTRSVGTSQPNVSKHLRVLSDAGILRREQRGNVVFYSIADETIFELCEVVCGSLEERLRRQAEVFSLA